MATPLELPMRGVETIDTLRAENIALKIQSNAQQQDLLDVRHALRLAEDKAGTWGGMKQRVTLNKATGAKPTKLWQDHLAAGEAAADAPHHHVAPNAAIAAPRGSSHAMVEASGDDGFSAEQLLVTMEQQLRGKLEELRLSADENQKLQDENTLLKEKLTQSEAALSAAKTAADKNPTATSQAYLMEQVSFLHSEVERLEGELTTVRQQSAEELRAAHSSHSQMIREKEDALRAVHEDRNRLRMRSSASRSTVSAGTANGPGAGEDLFTRCTMLENQLAAAISEKSAATTEKYEALAKVRKLEASLKERRVQATEAKKMADEEHSNHEAQSRSLSDALSALAAEKAQLTKDVAALKRQINAPTASSAVQCEDTTVPTTSTCIQTQPGPSHADAPCQVNTIRHFSDAHSESVQTVTHMLEEKCAELDSSRADLEQLAAVHRETLDFLEVTKKKLGDETAKRRLLDDDNEKLSLQVRSLQQQSSQQLAAIREREVAVQEAESTTQQALNGARAHEEERRKWEDQMKATQQDMQHLVTHQNLANQQISRLSAENDQLREQVESLMQTEAQGNYSLRAKDVELGELLSAYQRATEEVQGHVNARKTLERECENLRAAASSKEERVHHLQEQVAQLHQREQQLAVDLQSFDFETGQLHRKLVQAESDAAVQASKINDLQQTVAAGDRVSQEMDRNSAELMKQLVIKENENHLLKARCNQLEVEWSAIQSTHKAESTRLRELEDQNAKLVVKNIMGRVDGSPAHGSAGGATETANQLQRLQRELNDTKLSLEQTTESLRAANAAIKKEREGSETLHQQMKDLQARATTLEGEKRQLQEVLVELSKE